MIAARAVPDTFHMSGVAHPPTPIGLPWSLSNEGGLWVFLVRVLYSLSAANLEI
jgi:hypothetical protein